MPDQRSDDAGGNRESHPAASPAGSSLPMIRPMQDRGDELFRRLVDSVKDYAIFMLSPEGKVASWNEGAARIKGYRADEIVGRHFSTFYTPEALDAGWPEEELRRASASGRLEDEGWRVRKDGSRFWANVVITAMRDNDGRLLGFSKVTRDLTERREQERRLRESEESLRVLVEGVKDHATFLLDADGRVRTWNAGARRVTGLDADRAVGQHISILHPDGDRAKAVAAAELMAAELAGALQVEGWRQRAGGQQFWADVSITALRDAAGRPQGYVQIVRDLSERRRIEALETEGRRVNEFIAMLSHELRNPLAPIRNAMAIMRRFAEHPQATWCVDLVERQVTHMTRLVDDLLDVSRISTGKIRLEVGPLELNGLVQAAVEAASPLVSDHGHRLEVVPAPRPVNTRGDATRLTQVVVNLIHNAAKFTPPGGRISVDVRELEHVAAIRVTDTGIGMSASLIERAFDPFVQGARTLDRAEGGLGIGLTLVKSITELHGGSVGATSPGPGQGTTFTVLLPKVAVPPAPPAAMPPVRGSGRRILVVDDSPDAADSLAVLLELQGHQVRVAHDGPAALEAAPQFQPDIVLLDIGLPGMDGYEVARRLRALPGLPATRLIALTGYGQDSDRQAALAAGFDQHVTKPVDPDDLERIVA